MLISRVYLIFKSKWAVQTYQCPRNGLTVLFILILQGEQDNACQYEGKDLPLSLYCMRGLWFYQLEPSNELPRCQLLTTSALQAVTQIPALLTISVDLSYSMQEAVKTTYACKMIRSSQMSRQAAAVDEQGIMRKYLKTNAHK